MRSHRPTVIFLDFDDVICLNDPYGGYDAKRALAQQDSSQNQHNFEIWSKLFDAKAKANLRAINEEFSPQYVLSTSWVGIFEKYEIVEVLKRTGLDFVVEGMHQTWATPKNSPRGMRSVEISNWLRLHPEFANSWVVVDDKLSGSGFKHWSRESLSKVILCQEGVGLQEPEVAKLKTVLMRRFS